MSKDAELRDLIGKVLVSVTGAVHSDTVTFVTETGEEYEMSHVQDCCESVSVEDICGDLDDLAGSPITQAEESTSEHTPEGVAARECDESCTWTFYRIATAKGSVVIRWYGTSNGYYSERVDFVRTI